MSAAKKLKLGLVGGGPGSFIGAIHLNGALMDGMFELVCGAFSSNPSKSKQKGEGTGGGGGAGGGCGRRGIGVYQRQSAETRGVARKCR